MGLLKNATRSEPPRADVDYFVELRKIWDFDLRSLLPTKDGQDAFETVMLILPSLFYTAIALLVSALIARPNTIITFLVEFALIIIPVILTVTILADYVTNLIPLTIFVVVFNLLIYIVYSGWKRRRIALKPPKKSNPNKKDYITNCRAMINMIAVVAILAVDFKIFPRRYGKTHKTGFSLMDVGVGLYILANGVVAPELRGKKSCIKDSIKGSVILLIIGLLRLQLTQMTKYHVADSEYGIHWNFFITLAFTKILSSCILNIIRLKYVIISAVLISIAHETSIQLTLKKWVFEHTERDNFLNANKEGIVSSVGYVALYLYVVYFMYCIKQNERNIGATSMKFVLCCVLSLSVTIFCNYFFEVSRRLADTGYVFWVLFIGYFMTWLFYLAEALIKYVLEKKTKYFLCAPIVFEAINYNGLVFFLVGNVLTGIINLSVNTKQVLDINALVILIVYMFVNSILVYLLYVKQWKLKC